MKNKLIILTGMPGAGKGTISDYLKQNPNIKHLSTGDLFRSLDPKTEIGKKIASIIGAGKMVDDATVNEMVEPHLVSGKDLLLDGYPRSVEQARWLLKHVEGKFDTVAILLEINEQIAEHRRDKRLRETIEAGKTPRADDADPEALKKRFAEYHEKTEPMMEFLRMNIGDGFYTIDGSGTPDDVFQEVKKILEC